jgi:hypothetical protein
VRDLVDGLARWPLLLGAVILYAVAIWEETNSATPDAASNIIAFGSASVASVLLGAWIWSIAIETERRHYSKRHPVWKEDRDESGS